MGEGDTLRYGNILDLKQKMGSKLIIFILCLLTCKYFT